MSILAPIHPKRVDREGYLSLERRTDQRHELVEGHAYAMVGGTEAHNLITRNLSNALYQVRGTCRIFQQGMKLRIATDLSENFFYPDVIAVCDPADDTPGWKERPVFLAEVLSPSTAHNDWGLKLFAYRTLPSLEEYAVIEAEAAAPTIYRRADGWQPQEIDVRSGVRLGTFNVRLDFDTVYAGVTF